MVDGVFTVERPTNTSIDYERKHVALERFQVSTSAFHQSIAATRSAEPFMRAYSGLPFAVIARVNGDEPFETKRRLRARIDSRRERLTWRGKRTGRETNPPPRPRYLLFLLPLHVRASWARLTSKEAHAITTLTSATVASVFYPCHGPPPRTTERRLR